MQVRRGKQVYWVSDEWISGARDILRRATYIKSRFLIDCIENGADRVPIPAEMQKKTSPFQHFDLKIPWELIQE